MKELRCRSRRFKIRRSSNFDRKLRLEIGLKFPRLSGGRLNFLRSGVTLACLKIVGKVDSVKQRFRSVVIGGRRASRQDLRSQVGIISREYEELG